MGFCWEPPGKSLGIPWGTPKNFPGQPPGIHAHFPGFCREFKKNVGEFLGYTRASPVTNPCGTRPSISRGISGNFPGFYRDFPGKSLGDGWQTPGGIPNISLGNPRESMQICRAFAGTSLENLWGILGVHPSISRDKSLGAFPKTQCQKLFSAGFPKDFL